jgi:hypothetical protein
VHRNKYWHTCTADPINWKHNLVIDKERSGQPPLWTRLSIFGTIDVTICNGMTNCILEFCWSKKDSNLSTIFSGLFRLGANPSSSTRFFGFMYDSGTTTANLIGIRNQMARPLSVLKIHWHRPKHRLWPYELTPFPKLLGKDTNANFIGNAAL